MHLLHTSPNSIANSSISRDDDGFVRVSEDLDLTSSLSSSSSFVSSSLSFALSVSSDWDFFFFEISSSSLVVVDFKRFGGGGFEFDVIGAERFFYSKEKENYSILLFFKLHSIFTVSDCEILDIVCESDLESDDDDSGEDLTKRKTIKFMLIYLTFLIKKRLTLGDLLLCLFSLISSSINSSNCSDISDGFDKIMASARCK